METESNSGNPPPARWVVMGVSGSGKSEIGSRLAARLGVPFVEGDAYHTPASVAKMAAGQPLDDADRQEWLLRLQARLRAARERGEGMVLSCSSLKRRYRDLLRAGDPGLRFIHLVGDAELITRRMQARPNHFMPPALLASQFRDLEPPQADERAAAFDIRLAPERLVDQIVQTIRAPSNPGESANETPRAAR